MNTISKEARETIEIWRKEIHMETATELFNGLDSVDTIMYGVTSDLYVDITGNTTFRDIHANICEANFPGLDWDWTDMLPFWNIDDIEYAIDQYYVELEGYCEETV